MRYELSVNGRTVAVEAAPDTPMLWVLRDHLDLTGTKYGCGGGYCGACTIYVDGNIARSCQTPVSAVADRAISTIEALHESHPKLVEVWEANNVPQCGYCQSGQLMAAAALLDGNSDPSDADIDAAMVGNICRCGTYTRIRAAIHEVATHDAGGQEDAA